MGKEVFDPAIEWRWWPSLSAVTGDRTYRGLSEVEAATKDWLGSWEWFRIELKELVDAGEKVVALTRARGRPRGATSDVIAAGAEVWTMRNGKAIVHDSYNDWKEALQAAEVEADDER